MASRSWPRTPPSTTTTCHQHRRYARPRRLRRGSRADAVDGRRRDAPRRRLRGPLPQTRFVLRKALERGLPPIVVLNKIDRADARPKEVLNEVFDLFIDLDATEEQIEFPVLYPMPAMVSRRRIWPTGDNLQPLFDAIVESVPPPKGDRAAPCRCWSRISTRATISAVSPSAACSRHHQAGRAGEGTETRRNHRPTKVTKLFAFEGLKRMEIEQAAAGDIIAWPASRTSPSAKRSPTPRTPSGFLRSPSTSRRCR